MKKQEIEKSLEQIVFEAYKQRNEIEVFFDRYKNDLDTDVSDMQNRYVIEGCLFANFIAMMAYCKLYVGLRQAKCLTNYSPKDIMKQSKAICQMKIWVQWHFVEMTKRTRKLFADVGVDFQPKLE